MVDPYQYGTVIYRRGEEVEVYQGLKTDENKIVAIKILYFHNIEEANEKYKEVFALYQFKGTLGISNVYDCNISQSGNRYFLRIIMDYYKNGDLKKMIDRQIALRDYFNEYTLMEYLKQAAKLFAELQKRNIAHRDIKPENIFIDDNWNLVIGDLGCAAEKKHQNMTLAGTPLYLSPKLREAYICYISNQRTTLEHDSFKSDVYSLGLTFLFMATLRDLSSIVNYPRERRWNEIETIINSIQYNNDFKVSLKWMLQEDEEKRCDFIQLKDSLISCDFCKGRKTSIVQKQQPKSDLNKLGGKLVCNSCANDLEHLIMNKRDKY